jgi:hypothetical protein
MHPSGSCKCLHCGQFFSPDARNRGRQRYCGQAACRKASKAASQRQWLQRPGNEDHFRGPVNVARVQAWRQANPGYWKRTRRQGSGTLQEACQQQVVVTEAETRSDQERTLQDLLQAQSPVVVGLIAHLTGIALQEDIAAMTRTLHSRGRAVLGIDVPRPDYATTAKTPPRFTTRAASPAPL